MDETDREPSERERRLLRAYAAGTILATSAWWVGLGFSDALAKATLGAAFEPQGRTLLLPGDVFSAVVLPVLILLCDRKAPKAVAGLLWVHFGAQSYAFLTSIAGSLVDVRARFGLVAMLIAAGWALAFAARWSRLPILFGPFRFAEFASSNREECVRRTLLQTLCMWLVFFCAFPVLLVCLESWAGWRPFFPVPPWGSAGFLIGFLFAGVLACASGVTMAREGAGTPLPSESTKKLVKAGAYKWVRNPMALLSLTQGLCIAGLLQSGLYLGAVLVGAAFWEILVRPLEEQRLEEQFGDDYRAYREEVKCWIPLPPRMPGRHGKTPPS